MVFQGPKRALRGLRGLRNPKLEFSEISVLVAARFGASLGRSGPGRFFPFWVRRGAWRAENGHSGAHGWLFGVPRPMHGGTEPERGVEFFFRIVVLVGGSSCCLLVLDAQAPPIVLITR